MTVRDEPNAIRVLHVVHPATGGAIRRGQMTSDALTALCAQTVRRTPEARHQCVALGGTHAKRRARALGLPVEISVPTPAGSLAYASRFLRDLVRARRPDVVHAWGPGAAHAAADLRRKLGVSVVTTHAARHNDPRNAFATPASIATPGDLLLPPGPTRAEAAELLGLPPGAFVVALLSDAPGDGLAFSGVFSGGLLQTLTSSFAMIVSEEAHGLERAAAFKRRTALPWPLRVASCPMLLAVRAAHVAWIAPGRGTDPMPPGLALVGGACQAAGIPVVTDQHLAPALGGVAPGCAADGQHAAALFCATHALAQSRASLDEAARAALAIREPNAEAWTDAVRARWTSGTETITTRGGMGSGDRV